MIEASPELLTLLIFGGILIGVITGYPLAIVVGAVALLVGASTLGWTTTTGILYQRMYTLVQSYSLLAVPLFVFMGVMLESSGIADKLYDALYVWLGGLNGGLAIATVLIGTLMAACVGVIAASVTMLTLVALPSMLRRNYDKGMATGVCAVGGTLGILIPPSIMLVIYGPMAQLSVGKLFMGAIIPGLILAILYCVYIAVRCHLNPKMGPPVPVEERNMPVAEKTRMLLVSLAPPLILILAVLGSIFFGIAPPTEAAAVGAMAATLMVIVQKKFSFKVLKHVSMETLRLTCLALFIGAMSYSLVGVFMMLGCGDVVGNIILSMPGGRWGAFAAIMLVIFLLGFFIDWIGILFIVVPIVSPLAPTLGFDPVWFGIMICVNLQMAFNTPPLAPAIFFVRGCAPDELGVSTADIIRGIVPFVGLIIMGLAICVIFPQVITWLPNMMIK
ncbi:MAG: TRAP transporter large permease subunit [Dehalococcoidia bacterium]|nr:TRAP transporter large permease subunit [Dehalococcoidia bacterium]